MESIAGSRDVESGSRPKLNPTALRQTLAILSKQVKGTHDNRMRSEATAQFYVSSALALEVVGEEERKDTALQASSHRTSYGNNRASLIASAPLQYSGTRPLEPYPARVRSHGLKPWRVVGIVWMVEQEVGRLGLDIETAKVRITMCGEGSEPVQKGNGTELWRGG